MSSLSPHGLIYVVSILLSVGVQALVLLLVPSIVCYLTKDLNISIPSTHTQIVDRCLLGDECVAGMVIRKGINMHTQWTSVSLGFILSVSAARLIHLQLSRLVEQVRGNVVLRRGLNPQRGPAGCRGSDRWSRVTCPGVSVSLLLCKRVRVLSSGKQVDAPAPLLHSIQLRPPRCCQLRAGHLCLQCH